MAGRTTTTRNKFDEQNRSELNPRDFNFSNILDKFSGSSDVADFLTELGIFQPGDLSASQRTDWNKQLLDTLTNYKLTQENRAYNEGLRDEQRIYDNPISQLARLMGAGISRDQAIQMLSSGGSGSGGSGVPYSDPSAVADGIAPSQSRLNAVQATQAKLQTGLGFVQAAAGLVSLGFSAAQSFSQITMMKNSAYLSDKQRKAYDAASSAYGIINSAGISNSAKIFGSVESTAKTIQKLADSGNPAAKQYVDSGMLDTLRNESPYSSQFLANIHNTERSAKDYAEQFRANIERSRAETHLANMDADKIEEEIYSIRESIINLRADTDYKKSMTNLTNWQAIKVGSEIRLNNATANGIELDNLLQAAWMSATDDKGRSGMELYVDQRIQSMVSEVEGLIYANSKEQWKEQVDTYLSEMDNLQATYELGRLYANGEIHGLKTSTSNLANLLNYCRIADKCGLFDYVNAIATADQAGGDVKFKVMGQEFSFKSTDFSAKSPIYVLKGNNVSHSFDSNPFNQ